jgi:hypothetical protein
MAGKEGLNPQHTPEQIKELQASRTSAMAKAVEGEGQLLFTTAQIEKARQEMRQEIRLQKARQKIVDYLKGGDPARQQVVDDVIEQERDTVFMSVLTPSARSFMLDVKGKEWSTRRAQRMSQIKGYYGAELKFDYEVGDNYLNALRPIVTDPVERHLKFSRDLKKIRQEVEEKTQQPQSQAQQ